MAYPPDYQSATWLLPSSTEPAYAKYPALSGSFGAKSPFTVAVWVRVTGTNQSPANRIVTLSPKGEPTESPLLTCGNLWGWNYLSVTWANYVLTTDLARDVWLHVAVTFDGSALTLYIDGTPMDAAVMTQFASVSKPVFTLGANATQPPQGDTAGLIGGIRSFGYWTTALMSEQITAQMWSAGAAETDGLQILTDFTQNPLQALAGPSPALTNTTFLMDSYGLQSFGADVATPGAATNINPSAAAPFTIISWVAPQDYTADFSTGKKPRPVAKGCFFSNGDASDRGSMALSFSNGRPVVTFGDGQSLIASASVELNEWSSIAVTYDGGTCSMYVNGALKGSQAITPTAAPAPLPRLMGQVSNGAVTNGFSGILQYLSVWDIALTAEEVNAWLNEDPSNEPHCLADFAMSAEPLQDLVPIVDEAMWDENKISLGESMSWVSTNSIPSPEGSEPLATTARAPRIGLRDGARTPIGRTRRPRGRPRRIEEPFGRAHRQRMGREFEHALSSIRSPDLRQRLRAKYARELDALFERAAAGRLDLPRCRATRDAAGYILTYDSGVQSIPLGRIDVETIGTGEKPRYLLTFISPSGAVMSRLESESAECDMFWLSFWTTLIFGVLGALGLPTLPDLEDVVRIMLTDGILEALFGTLPNTAFTTITVLNMFEIFVQEGYLEKIVQIIKVELTLWSAAKLLAYIASRFTPFPTPQQVEFIGRLSGLAVTLTYMYVTEHATACG